MARTDTAYIPKHFSAGDYPVNGSFTPAADQLFPFNTIVTRDSSGNAVSPSTADASGFPAMGVSRATYDCRTESLDPPESIEVAYGVRGFPYTGTTPIPGDTMFVVDNQTLSVDSNGGVRGTAGPCVDVRDGKAYVWFSPIVAADAMGVPEAVVQSRALSLGFADLTDADGSQSFNLGAALPANAVLLGYSVNVTQAFGDGAAGVFTLDLGFAGDLDNVLDGGALGAIAQLYGSAAGRRSAVQLLATVLADVNVTTATVGAATIEVFFAVV